MILCAVTMAEPIGLAVHAFYALSLRQHLLAFTATVWVDTGWCGSVYKDVTLRFVTVATP